MGLGKVLSREHSLFDDIVCSFGEHLVESILLVYDNHTHSLSIWVKLHFPDDFELEILSKLPHFVHSNVSVEPDHLVIGLHKLKSMLLRKFYQSYLVWRLTLESYFLIILLCNTLVTHRQHFEKFLNQAPLRCNF